MFFDTYYTHIENQEQDNIRAEPAKSAEKVDDIGKDLDGGKNMLNECNFFRNLVITTSRTRKIQVTNVFTVYYFLD